MKHIPSLLWACHGLVLLCQPVIGQNLIGNGGFELSRGSSSAAGAGLTSLPMWTITTGATNSFVKLLRGPIASAPLAAPEGEQFVEFQGATLQQNVPTVPGQWYYVQFSVYSTSGRTPTVLKWEDTHTIQCPPKSEGGWSVCYGWIQGAPNGVSRLEISIPADTPGWLDDVRLLAVSAAESPGLYSYYLPHLADGGGFVSKIVITRRGQISFVGISNCCAPSQEPRLATVSVLGYDSIGGPLTLAGQPFSGTLLLRPHETVVLRTYGGAAAPLRAGWLRVASDSELTVSVIIDYEINSTLYSAGVLSQAPKSVSTGRFDNIEGVTGIAIANPNDVGISVTLFFRDDSGTEIPISRSVERIPRLGHAAWVLPSRFAASAGRRGTVEIRATSLEGGGPVSFLSLGFIFGTNGAFASVPY